MKLNRLATPLYQDEFKLSPASQAALFLTDEINWTFDVVTGRRGGKQVPIIADDNDNLCVADAAAVTAIGLVQTSIDLQHSGLLAGLTSTSDDITLADYFDSTEAAPPLYSCDGKSIAERFDPMAGIPPFYDMNDFTPIADIMDDMLTILTAVYNGSNALRTVAG